MADSYCKNPHARNHSAKVECNSCYAVLCLQVGAADVVAVVAAWTGIPAEALTAADAVRLQRLPETLAVSALKLYRVTTVYGVQSAVARTLAPVVLSCSLVWQSSPLIGDCTDGPMPSRCRYRAVLLGRRRRSRRRRGRCSGPERGCWTAAARWPPCCSAAPPALARRCSQRCHPGQPSVRTFTVCPQANAFH